MFLAYFLASWPPFPASGFHSPHSDLNFLVSGFHFLAFSLQFPNVIGFWIDLSWMLSPF